MKVKLKDDKMKICDECKSEITINECETHNDSHKTEGCYKCHLKKHHLVKVEITSNEVEPKTETKEEKGFGSETDMDKSKRGKKDGKKSN